MLGILANITQIGYSMAFGVVFAACFLRNRSIWPVVIMHAAIDFAGGLRHIAVNGDTQPVANNTLPAALFNLMVIALPLLVYGLFILRKVPVLHSSVESEREKSSHARRLSQAPSDKTTLI